MSHGSPIRFSSIADAAEYILSSYPQRLRLAAPLGLGKPIDLLNYLYDEVAKSTTRSLEIYTALSLLRPRAQSDVERRFLEPFADRQFGIGTPDLRYARAARQNALPANIRVHEFYFQAGQYLHRTDAQASYLSVNYTHAARAICDRGIDIVVQLVARNPQDPNEYSLSCNPDVTLDIADLHRQAGKPLPIYAVVHPDLPFTRGDAVVTADFFAGIVDDAAVNHELFALPRLPVDTIDHMIGLHASRLVQDDGTLQIGIGSLSDALVHSMILRHTQNSLYQDALKSLPERVRGLRVNLHDGPFTKGIYGTSEMIMDGFMHLRRSGILNRFIFDQDEKKLRYLHGAFFLGSKEFYRWLRELQGDDLSGFSMTRVSKVNDLYDAHELALRRQRKNARFFNTCMKVSVLGGVVSDTLESGDVVSGVGGQYNFVAMSHELPDSHSILMLRSTRSDRGRKRSNIVLSQPHETIPRHLRDIVITEYGIACLRGRTDEEVIQSMIEISDVEFQDELVIGAKKNGKLKSSYQVPDHARRNSAHHVETFMKSHRKHFPEFPFGSDFTPTELQLVKALSFLKSSTAVQKVATLTRGLISSKAPYTEALARMGVQPAKTAKEHLLATILTGALDRELNDHGAN